MQPDETVWSALLRRREEILAHPRHDEARALQDRLYFEVIHPERFPGKLKVDVRRMMLLGLVMTGDATAEEADPSTWPTLVRLKATMRQFDMDGARRIDELVARLAQTGYIRLDPHPADRRVRWVRPQEPLRVWFLEWLTVYFEAHHLLFPDPTWMRTTRRHPGFLAAFLRSASRNLALPG